jgi:hypothetical protein
LKTRLGKVIIGTAIGAGALGVGFGGSLAVASAATTHTTSATTSSSGTTTTAVNEGSASPGTASPSATPKATPKGTHNCQNMKGGHGMPSGPASGSTAS